MSSRKRRIKRHIRILMRMDAQVRLYYPRRKLHTSTRIMNAMAARITRWAFIIGDYRFAAQREPYARTLARIKITNNSRMRLEDLAMWETIRESDEALDNSVPL